MIDFLCMILSVIKLFIHVMAFHFKSTKGTINLTERKTEKWTSRRLYILIKKGEKVIKLVHNHILIPFSVSVQELDCFIVLWSVKRCLQKLSEKVFCNGCRIVFYFQLWRIKHICDSLDTTQTSDYCVCMLKKSFC